MVSVEAQMKGPARHFTAVETAWCEEARLGLKDTFWDDCGQRIQAGVESGKYQLWHVNGDSWLVTEVTKGMLFVWCYQGFGWWRLFCELCKVAHMQGLACISFFTHHKAAVRMLRAFKPEVLPTQCAGETQYIIRLPVEAA
jgi:hypothetical protein